MREENDFNVKVLFDGGMVTTITFENDILLEDYTDDLEVKVLMLGDSAVSQNYNNLSNKPSIEGVPLIGNQSFAALTLQRLTNSEIEEITNG